MNDFAAAATDNKISSILSEDKVDALTRIILLNAVYFKGKGGGEPIIFQGKSSPRNNFLLFFLFKNVSATFILMGKIELQKISLEGKEGG